MLCAKVRECEGERGGERQEGEEGNEPRARNLSSERIAMAFTSSTQTKNLELAYCMSIRIHMQERGEVM